MIYRDEAAVARKINHPGAKVIRPDEPSEAAYERCHRAGGPALVGEADKADPIPVSRLRSTSTEIGIPRVAAKAESPQVEDLPTDEAV